MTTDQAASPPAPGSAAAPAPPGRSFALLGAGEAAARAISFVTLLVLARRLGPASYGVIGVTSGIMLYLTQVADGGIELVGVPAIARAREDRSALVSAVLTMRAAIALGLTVLLAPAVLLLLPRPEGPVLATYLLTLVFTALSARWVFIGLQRPAAVAGGRVLGELLGSALALLAVTGAADLGLVPVAALVAAVVSSAAMLAALPRVGVRLRPRLDWARCAGLFGQARHMLVFTLLGLLLFNFDLVFLRFMHGREVAGLYAAAYAIISFGANVIVAYAHSVLPILSTPGGDHARPYRRALVHAFTLALPAGVGGALVAPALLDLVFGPAFRDGAASMQWLLLTLPVAALREIAVVALIASRGERRLVHVNAQTAVANIALNLLLVPRYGMMGAALATVATEVFRLWRAASEAAAAGFPWPPVTAYLRPVVAAAIMWGTLRATGLQSLVPTILVGMVCYAVGLLLTGGVRVASRALPTIAD